MKNFGYLFIAIGVSYVLFALNMDVSTRTSAQFLPGVGLVGGDDVANLDLMARRQNHVIVASMLTLAGVLLAIFGPSVDANEAKMRLSQQKFWRNDSERNLSFDPYRLWLASQYGIERNDVFDRFVMGDQTFENLEEALACAHGLELQAISAALSATQRRDEDLAAKIAEVRSARQVDEARWQERLPKVIVAGVLLIGLASGGYYFFSQNPSPDIELKIAEEAEKRVTTIAKLKEPVVAPPISLERSLKFGDPSKCTATGTLEKVFAKLDQAREKGAAGFVVKLDELATPLSVVAVKTTDADEAVNSESSVRFPERARWHGLKLSRIKTSEYDPMDTDSSYSRYLTFLEAPSKVQAVLNDLNFNIVMAPSYSDLAEPDGICGGSMRLERIQGGTSLSCSWGC